MLLGKNLVKEDIKMIIKKYQPSNIVLPIEMKKNLNFSETEVKKTKYAYGLYKLNESKQYKIDDELCLLLSTSGSTGSRKFVKLSYQNLDSNLSAIVKSLKISKKDQQ